MAVGSDGNVELLADADAEDAGEMKGVIAEQSGRVAHYLISNPAAPRHRIRLIGSY
jgi:hypothetical protein